MKTKLLIIFIILTLYIIPININGLSLEEKTKEIHNKIISKEDSLISNINKDNSVEKMSSVIITRRILQFFIIVINTIIVYVIFIKRKIE